MIHRLTSSYRKLSVPYKSILLVTSGISSLFVLFLIYYSRTTTEPLLVFITGFRLGLPLVYVLCLSLGIATQLTYRQVKRNVPLVQWKDWPAWARKQTYVGWVLAGIGMAPFMINQFSFLSTVKFSAPTLPDLAMIIFYVIAPLFTILFWSIGFIHLASIREEVEDAFADTAVPD